MRGSSSQTIVQKSLKDLGEVYRTGGGVGEESYYTAMESLLNEAEYVTEMARRIAALILMQPELDANCETVKADTYPWPHEE